MLKITECPRDAMQGIRGYIPARIKADYINTLLRVGFDTIDFGSFVSPSAVPQMADTKEVLSMLNIDEKTRLLAIVANERGATEASLFNEISVLGYPFSISENFQHRNSNSGRENSMLILERIHDIVIRSGKSLVVYLSMGFGNPYGEEWNLEILEHWSQRIADSGIMRIAIADTVGTATPERISLVFAHLKKSFSEIEFGVHLHSQPGTFEHKVQAAYDQGCLWFDSAINGFGGCPFAGDDLVGNIDTEKLIHFMQQKGEKVEIDLVAFSEALKLADNIFTKS
jgi:hydroxymethylglutaryl-CoA lyase